MIEIVNLWIWKQVYLKQNVFKNWYQVVLHFIILVLFLDVRLLWSCCHTINNFVLKNFSRYIVIVSRDHAKEYSVFFSNCTKQVTFDNCNVAENKNNRSLEIIWNRQYNEWVKEKHVHWWSPKWDYMENLWGIINNKSPPGYFAGKHKGIQKGTIGL